MAAVLVKHHFDFIAIILIFIIESAWVKPLFSQKLCSSQHSFHSQKNHAGFITNNKVYRKVSQIQQRGVATTLSQQCSSRICGNRKEKIWPLKQQRHDTDMIDPILSSMIERHDITTSSLSISNHDVENILPDSVFKSCSSPILCTSEGLKVWRRILVKGRTPVDSDFDPFYGIWPSEVYGIYDNVVQVVNTIGIPNFVNNHPKAVDAVLITILQLAVKISKQLNEMEETNVIESKVDSVVDVLENLQTDEFYDPIEDDAPIVPQSLEKLIFQELTEKWGNLVSSVSALDALFGANHGLLETDSGTDLNNTGHGFGLNDGIWEHTGWTVIPKIQYHMSLMPELRNLMNSIGRRSTSQASTSRHKFLPRKFDKDGGLGAMDDSSIRSSVSGLSLSNNLAEMVPSEAVLLRGSNALRRLFLAKKIESKLLSYQMSGWTDVSSVETRRLRSLAPSGPGGPIILCLDTSWSMSGNREILSKTVTLACVSAAHKQKRECYVIAFSNAKGVMETGLITPNGYGIRRLLDFLSNSFLGGGTDVTGALKHAMLTLDSTDNHGLLSAADLLLVTDGEIPDPPVSDKIMSDLNILRQRFGMQVHGLLIGKKESIPLSKLCSHVHTFLSDYDTETVLKMKATNKIDHRNDASTSSGKSPFLSSNRLRHDSGPYKPYTKTTTQLHSIKASGEFGFINSNIWNRKRKLLLPTIAPGNRRIFHMSYDSKFATMKNVALIGEDDLTTNTVTFNDKVESLVLKLQHQVDQQLSEMTGAADELDKERLEMGSCWRYNSELRAAIDVVRMDLIERDEEAMLVVLGMITREHVILLGPPGTAKSALGRRLSILCGGFFFQRLLTKFTTPEEIFGPLSLRSLENDEYRRCTDGFLPTASIAFLDEIFKANSAILNTLLTILNERKFDNGAGVRQRCPIQCVVGASNELPESEDLDALYDRFLLRKEVQSVSDDGIIQLLSSTSTVKPQDDDVSVFQEGLDSVIEGVNVAADNVVLGLDACSLIRDLRTFMKDEFDVRISDRRLVKAASLLKIVAATNGRSSVDALDCLLLEHIAWQRPEQRKAIHDWLWMNLTPDGGNKDPSSPMSAVEPFRIILNGLHAEAMLAVRKTSGDISGKLGALPQDVALIQSLTKEISNISDLIQSRMKVLARHIEVIRTSTNHIWLTSDTAIAAQQQLLPKANKILTEMKKVYGEAIFLINALSDQDIDSSIRLSVLEYVFDNNNDRSSKYQFTDDELDIGMKEAKSRYDIETFRAWKRARKKNEK